MCVLQGFDRTGADEDETLMFEWRRTCDATVALYLVPVTVTVLCGMPAQRSRGPRF